MNKSSVLAAILLLTAVNVSAQREVFASDPDKVWSAVVDAVTASHLAVKSIDKASGVLWLEDWSKTGAWQNGLVKEYTTRKVSAWSNWRGFRMLNSSIVVQQVDEGVAVSCRFLFEGNEAGARWLRLESNNSAESMLLAIVKKSLADKSNSPTILDPDVPALEQTIAALERVDAAFKVESPTSEIGGYLVEAQSQLDRVTPKAETAAIRDHVTASLKAFVDARKASEQDREKALLRARAALRDGQDSLQRYKSTLPSASAPRPRS